MKPDQPALKPDEPALKLVSQEVRVVESTVGTVQPSCTLAEQLARVAMVATALELLKRLICINHS